MFTVAKVLCKNEKKKKTQCQTWMRFTKLSAKKRTVKESEVQKHSSSTTVIPTWMQFYNLQKHLRAI